MLPELLGAPRQKRERPHASLRRGGEVIHHEALPMKPSQLVLERDRVREGTGLAWAAMTPKSNRSGQRVEVLDGDGCKDESHRSWPPCPDVPKDGCRAIVECRAGGCSSL